MGLVLVDQLVVDDQPVVVNGSTLFEEALELVALPMLEVLEDWVVERKVAGMQCVEVAVEQHEAVEVEIRYTGPAGEEHMEVVESFVAEAEGKLEVHLDSGQPGVVVDSLLAEERMVEVHPN
jgi:hypothetical protein